jgi:hypothetical protein
MKMKTFVEKNLGVKYSQAERNFEKWIARKHPDDLYSAARYLAVTALNDVLEYSTMKPSKEQRDGLHDLRIEAGQILAGFYMKVPALDKLKQIAAGHIPA